MHPPLLLEADQIGAVPPDELRASLRQVFAELSAGRAVQPPQDVLELPGGGDVITYRGVLADPAILAVKLSPYLPQANGPAVVTAWTLLLDLTTGAPIALLDATALTTERTAATTALAVDLLAPVMARKVAVVGAGPIALAHLRHVSQVRNFNDIRIYSRSGVLGRLPDAIADRVEVCTSVTKAITNAEVILLCTSAAAPVIDVNSLSPGTLVTSVSTNAPLAHEIDPAMLPTLEVYCDFRETTPSKAGEMQLGTAGFGWSPTSIIGDLPELVTGRATMPSGESPVFFRSVGLGLEDAAVAVSALNQQRAL